MDDSNINKPLVSENVEGYSCVITRLKLLSGDTLSVETTLVCLFGAKINTPCDGWEKCACLC